MSIKFSLSIYEAHALSYERCVQAANEIKPRVISAESELIAAMDSANIGSFTDKGRTVTIVTGADGKRMIVAPPPIELEKSDLALTLATTAGETDVPGALPCRSRLQAQERAPERLRRAIPAEPKE